MAHIDSPPSEDRSLPFPIEALRKLGSYMGSRNTPKQLKQRADSWEQCSLIRDKNNKRQKEEKKARTERMTVRHDQNIEIKIAKENP